MSALSPPWDGGAPRQPPAHWIGRLEAPEPDVRREAAEALRRLGASAAEAVPALSAALRDPDPEVRGAALSALVAVGGRALSSIASALQAPDWKLRRGAAAALARLAASDEGAAAELVTAAASEDAVVAASAAEALAALGPRALGGLRRSLGHSDPRVVEKALALIERLGPAAQPLLPLLATLPAALRALVAVEGAGDRSAEALVGAVERLDARRLLANLSWSPAGLKRLKILLAHPDESKRRAAEEVARRSGVLPAEERPVAAPAKADAAGLRRLVDALSGPERWAAARALGDLGAEGAAALPALIDHLAGDDPGPSLEALRRMGPAAAPAAPALAWRAAAFDDPDARAALKAVGAPRASALVDASLARVRPRVSAAEEGAPLKAGDRVLAIDGAPLLTAAEWPRDAKRLTVFRDGATLEVPCPWTEVEIEDTLESLAEGHARTPGQVGRALEYAKKLFEKGEYVRCVEIARPLHERRPGTPAQALAGAAAVAYGLRAGNLGMAGQGLQWVEAYRKEAELHWTSDIAAIAAGAVARHAEATADPDRARAAAAEAALLAGGQGPWVGRLFPTSYTLPWLPSLEPYDDGAPRAFRGPLVVVLLGKRRGAAADEQLRRLALVPKLAVHVVTETNQRMSAGSFDVLYDEGGALSRATGTTVFPMLFWVNAEGVVEEQSAVVTGARARRWLNRVEGRLPWTSKAQALPPPDVAARAGGREGRLKAFVAVGNGVKPGPEDAKALMEEVKRRHPGVLFDERTLHARFGVAGWKGSFPEAELTARCRTADPQLAAALEGARLWWEEHGKLAGLLALTELPKIALTLSGPWTEAGAPLRALAASLAIDGERALDPETGRSFRLSIAPGAATLTGSGGSPENARALMKAAQKILRAGATEVRVEPAGPAHPAARWIEMTEAPADGFRVRALVAHGTSRSTGMHAFGLRDVELADRRLSPEEVAKSLEIFNLWQVKERPELRDGQTVSPLPGRPCLLLGKSDRINPYGLWTLTPV